ncbi:MAG TPA: FMN-binding negative transcriptional regulator [Chloroflexota bacterium]|nr:FMN-binding negative transcriptional regulator [Chloroflexota bacterium]
MYIPAHFEETRREVLHDLIRRHSFGTLVSQTANGLFATHLPLLLDAERGEHGVLRGHMARANPHWRSFVEEDAGESLAIFNGPHAYVSPSWYETERAVPTWNYAVVHAHGRPLVVEDDAEIRRLLDATVDEFEQGFERPWSTARLPQEYVNGMVAGIVAFELPISRLEGKLKLSQNRPAVDRERVMAALRAQGSQDSTGVAERMATLEREREAAVRARG